MIDLGTARRLLDFGARMGQGPRAEEQLQGAVAIHNILERHRVAYLADEVGMGKTYVALGAMALLRHFNPELNVLIIAPRENIQRKWMKELRNFAAYNVRFADLRNRAIDDQPGRPLVACNNLIEFVHDATVDSRRDFFLRLSSFSLGLSDGDDRSGWRALRDRLLEAVPWLDRGLLSTRVRKEDFKDNFGRAVCCAIPAFDLVIVDEGHNLKHGLGRQVAARNRVLALALGHPAPGPWRRDFPRYGRRARRVLFLSATPLEDTYRHIWNQLDVLGMGAELPDLRREDLDNEAKKQIAARVLIRRVTSIAVASEPWTKNQYRREWRSGGVQKHDDPITVTDSRQRLVVALIQKKVAELLGSERFNMSFQIGMLASFESFLETARVKRAGEDESGNFDDPDQTDDQAEREGIDVRDINRLSRLYSDRFNEALPHPKMDAIVETLAHSWQRGKKSLIFVRRVASVKELKRKLDRRYDDWLLATLRDRLPEGVRARFDRVVQQYLAERRATFEDARNVRAAVDEGQIPAHDELDQDDRGGADTFFAWFFRGTGPEGVISGANVQRRFIQRGTTYATFFEDNFVADLLDVEPGAATDALARQQRCSVEDLRRAIRLKAARYLSQARRHPRGDRIEAAQAAAVELLMEGQDALADQARLVWHERFETSLKKEAAGTAPEIGDELEVATFFTEIRRPEWRELRATLWPDVSGGSLRERFRQRQLRAQLLATAARLGHALIDLYVLTIGRLESLELRTLDREAGDEAAPDARRAITDYLKLLEDQRCTPLAEKHWGAFDELAEIAGHFELILDVNAPDARTTPLAETARLFGSQLRQQQPVAGMSGQINRTVIQQFRMPGYPFALITTDLLQEGEDLHTFCSSVYHYGISGTPSATEQRIGRIDRVRSLTDRRLNGLDCAPDGDQKLQVFYPYLSDTVEVLQVDRMLRRMNSFLRLMHEGLSVPKGDSTTIDVSRELVSGRRAIEAITTRLTTAFPVPAWALEGGESSLAVDEGVAASAIDRFKRLRDSIAVGTQISWEPTTGDGRMLGTVELPNGRVQPFALVLRSDGERLIVRCVSPVGQVGAEEQVQEVVEAAARCPGRIGVILTGDATQYDITVEDDVALAAPEHDGERVAMLLRRVVGSADSVERHRFGTVDHPMRAFDTDLRREGLDAAS